MGTAVIHTLPGSGSPRRRFGTVLVLVGWFVGGCAGTSSVARGDRLLGEGRYLEAIAAYEEALVRSPGQKRARKGIRSAHRGRVGTLLMEAEKKASAGEILTAFRFAMEAQRVPLALEELDLRRRIEAALTRYRSAAEKEIATAMSRGWFLRASSMAGTLAEMSGSESDARRAQDVRAQSADHYQNEAARLSGQDQPAVVFLRLAWARRLEARISDDAMLEAWKNFLAATCFAAPMVRLKNLDPEALIERDGPTVQKKGSSSNRAEVVATVQRAVNQMVASRAELCAHGTLPLSVHLTLESVSAFERSWTENTVHARPGFQVEVEETYLEEITEEGIEEYVEEVERTVKEEKRDCAPRPGQPPGCRTWIEERKVRVPVKKNRVIARKRKVERRRPASGPFPSGSVVVHPSKIVVREVHGWGRIEVDGFPDSAQAFACTDQHRNRSYPARTDPSFPIPARPQRLRSWTELASNCADASSEAGSGP